MITIPPHARCVYRGLIYAVYHWEQELFDGRRVTFEGLRRPDVAVVIPVEGETIWLAREEQPGLGVFWTHFGGFVDAGEAPLEAARRELREEAGMEAGADGWELLHVHEHPGKVESRTFVYVARGVRRSGGQSLDGGERIEVVGVGWARWLEIVQSAELRGQEELLGLLRGEVSAAQAEALRGVLFGASR